MHSGRSWTFRNRRTGPGRTGHNGPSRTGGTACSSPVSSGGQRHDARRRQQSADGRTPPSLALPRLAAVPGPDDRSQADPAAVIGFEARVGGRESRRCHRHAMVLPGLPAACRRSPPVSPPRAGRPRQRCRCLPVPDGTCRAHRPDPANEPPTDDQKGLTASGDQAPDLHLLVAGAGFEPATSGL
jgi:hypothetical protein